MHDASGLGRRAFLKGLVGTAAGAALSPNLGEALDRLEPFAVHFFPRPGAAG